MKDLVSTGEAAQRLGVSAATIQRWVDAGTVSAIRTHGGHRRIPISEVRRALAARGSPILAEPIANWIKVLLTGDAVAVRAALLAARRRMGAWTAVAEEIAAAFAEVGRLWEIGSCQVFEEHAASEALHRATASCASKMRLAPTAKKALLISAAGDRHTLGLSLAELIVLEAGWNVNWLGEGPPIEELDLLAELRKPKLLIVSASSASSRQALAGYQSALELLAVQQQIRLVLAGDGPWIRSRVADRVESFSEFTQVLAAAESQETLLPSKP